MRAWWRWWQTFIVAKEVGEVIIRVIIGVRRTTGQTSRRTSSRTVMRRSRSCVVINRPMGCVGTQGEREELIILCRKTE